MSTRNSHRTTSLSDYGVSSNDSYKNFCISHSKMCDYTIAIMTDINNMNPLYGTADLAKDCKTVQRRFLHEGLPFLTKTLPNLYDRLLTYLEDGDSVYPSFKIKHGAKYPVFLQKLFAPIYEDHTSDNAVICMEHLYQLCVPFKKLKGPYKQGVLVEQLDKFVATDRSLLFNKWTYPSEDEFSILNKARHLIGSVLKGIDPNDPNQSKNFLPRPGPGATNSPTKPHERYRPHVRYHQLRPFDLAEWYDSSSLNYRGSRGILLDENGIPADRHEAITASSLLTSRFKFVHKDFGKARGICIEQLEIQWLQQAVRMGLTAIIENHPLTKGYVNFTDQSINGLLALQASSISSVVKRATIDMSEASNRISRKLVEYVYGENKELLLTLLCLSTRVIELPQDLSPTKKFLETNMFAPMGSAICFPVMGLLHYAIVKAIISTYSQRHINDVEVWVFGDDIIIPQEHAEKVFEVLPAFGMKLNRDKSFVKSLFRESCGVHAYNGRNITPVRFKSIVHDPLSVNDVVSALRSEYALFKKGYLETAKLIRSEILSQRDVKAECFPVVGPESPVLGWIRDQGDATIGKNYHFLRRRWNKNYQRYLYKARVIVEIKPDDIPPICEDEYYLRKQVINPTFAKVIGESPRGFTTRWCWLPDSAFSR